MTSPIEQYAEVEAMKKVDVLSIMWGDAADAAQYRRMFMAETDYPSRLKDSDAARLIATDLISFAKEFLADYQSEEGMASMKYYAGKAYQALERIA